MISQVASSISICPCANFVELIQLIASYAKLPNPIFHSVDFPVLFPITLKFSLDIFDLINFRTFKD